MSLDYAALESLLERHPGWRLLRADDAALLGAFLDRVFVTAKARSVPSSALVEALEDDLFRLRETFGESAFPRPAAAYLEAWTAPDKGWLRESYPPRADEPHYEPTPEALSALAWLGRLGDGEFPATESRLAMLLELVAQMSEGSESDTGKRLEALRRRRDALETEMARVAAGDVPVLAPTALKERFQQFVQLSRELLIAFRGVEQDLRRSDRGLRERLAASANGDIADRLPAVSVSDCDAARSLEAAWTLLHSRRLHEALSEQLARLLSLPALADLQLETGMQRAGFDWFEAGEHARETLVALHAQLERFMREGTWLDNRHIAERVTALDTMARTLDAQADASVMHISPARAALDPRSLSVDSLTEAADDTDGLTAQRAPAAWDEDVDRESLAIHMRETLLARGEITLQALIEARPLQHGLSELLTYLRLARERFESRMDDGAADAIAWKGPVAEGVPALRQAVLPRCVLSQ